jgi:hypothetical protein
MNSEPQQTFTKFIIVQQVIDSSLAVYKIRYQTIFKLIHLKGGDILHVTSHKHLVRSTEVIIFSDHAPKSIYHNGHASNCGHTSACR